jgi:quercetin dioxygenase-like cupin family protein
MSFFVHGAGGAQPHAEASATLVGAGTAETLLLGSTEVGLVAPGSLTAGRYGLFRFDLPPGAGGARPHIHTGFSESFYVLSGTPTLLDGRTWAPAGPGSFLHVPEHGVHGFRNDTEEMASFLVLFAPGTPVRTSSGSWPRSRRPVASCPRPSGPTSTTGTTSTPSTSTRAAIAAAETRGRAGPCRR